MFSPLAKSSSPVLNEGVNEAGDVTLGIHKPQAAEVAPGAAAQVVAGGVGEEAVVFAVTHGWNGDVVVTAFLTAPAVGVGRRLGRFFDPRAVVGAVQRFDFKALPRRVVVTPTASALPAYQPVKGGHAPGNALIVGVLFQLFEHPLDDDFVAGGVEGPVEVLLDLLAGPRAAVTTPALDEADEFAGNLQRTDRFDEAVVFGGEELFDQQAGGWGTRIGHGGSGEERTRTKRDDQLTA